MYTYAHTCMCTPQPHIHMHTPTTTCPHACIHTSHMHTILPPTPHHTHACIHVCTHHTHVHTPIPHYTHMHILTPLAQCSTPRMHTHPTPLHPPTTPHTHTCVHTHSHTHTHMYTRARTHLNSLLSSSHLRAGWGSLPSSGSSPSLPGEVLLGRTRVLSVVRDLDGWADGRAWMCRNLSNNPASSSGHVSREAFSTSTPNLSPLLAKSAGERLESHLLTSPIPGAVGPH